MGPSGLILAGGAVIIGVGVVYAVSQNRPLTKVFAGGIGVVLIASLFDVLGGGFATFGAAIIGLAVFSVLLIEGPALYQALSAAQAK